MIDYFRCDHGRRIGLDDCDQCTSKAAWSHVKRMHKERIKMQVEIEHLRQVAKAADMVSSMSSYDEDADEVLPCHIVYISQYR